MRIRLEQYLFDTKLHLWGGNMYDGMSTSTYCCPGYNTLAAYIDKELPAKARKAVEDHMAACKDCRYELIHLRRMIQHINTTMHEVVS